MMTRCTRYEPDRNGECIHCDEPADAHEGEALRDLPLPPAMTDREAEVHRVAAEHAARHARGIQRRAEHVCGALLRWVVRELQDPEVRQAVLTLIDQTDATNQRWRRP